MNIAVKDKQKEKEDCSVKLKAQAIFFCYRIHMQFFKACILLDMHEYLILILNKAALFCFNSKRLLRFHYDFFRLDRSKGILHSVHP
ncbi:hypothetical protein DW093_01140 [Erysipelotrichaceae bacterium AM07-12]|nr:hypothetical protein DW093_01140 [Erysipelotrichaceae bacterium AM07-12]